MQVISSYVVLILKKIKHTQTKQNKTNHMKGRESERKSFDFLGLFFFKLFYIWNQHSYFSFESLEKLVGILASVRRYTQIIIMPWIWVN